MLRATSAEVERVGVVELRERRADDEVAEQPRVVERGVGLREHRCLALGVEHVADDERLELVAQRERSVDGGLDLVEAEVEAGLPVPARVEVRDAELLAGR